MSTPWSIYSPPKKSTTASAAVSGSQVVNDFFGRTPDAAELLKPISLPKVPGADPLIKDSFDFLTPLKTRVQGDLEAYRNAIGLSQPDVAKATAQEIADMERVFSPGGYQADLAGIRQQRMKAMEGLNDVLLGDLRRALSLNSRGGTAGTGLGSYLARVAAGQAGKIRSEAAVDDANQARGDLAALMAARASTAGRRQSATDALVARLLNPAEKDLAAESGYSSALQRALQTALMNLTQAWGISAY